MKKLLKFIGAVAAIFSAMLGALTVFDRVTQKNRIKNGYLECDIPETESKD